uniref:Sulfotransferase domain-containing protein n=1 Tax=Ditylenchus dipsaci TaxID=166011 RepID=A0A915D713_9BILA
MVTISLIYSAGCHIAMTEIYEEILADLKGTVFKIGNFIGGRATEQVNCEKDLNRIVSHSAFGSMKKDQFRWFPQQYNIDTFIRQGNIRDWKNYISRQKVTSWTIYSRRN